MPKYLTRTILAALLLCALTGCGAMLEREYLYVGAHEELYEEEEDPSALRAENYLGLKNAILRFVEEGTENGVIRLYNYSGDVEEDVTSAAKEVSTKDPLGAYAIDYIAHNINRIVSYYEINIYITFRRSVDEMSRVVRVSGNADIRDKLGEALESFEELLLLRTSYYNEFDFEAALYGLYYENPACGFGLPEIKEEHYPDTGIQRIIELSISYPHEADKMRSMYEELAKAAEKAADGLKDIEFEPELAYAAYKALSENIRLETSEPDSGGAESAGMAATAYGALIESVATREGLAMAYKLLCDELGINCLVVNGHIGGEEGFWNIVGLGGDYYHVDAARYGLQSPYQSFFLSDSRISETYSWDTEIYPVCGGPLSKEGETDYEAVDFIPLPRPENNDLEPEADTEAEESGEGSETQYENPPLNEQEGAEEGQGNEISNETENLPASG